MLHELQICKSYTVQIDCRARAADGVYLAAPLRPADLKSKSRHVEDTHVASSRNPDYEILRKINKEERMRN